MRWTVAHAVAIHAGMPDVADHVLRRLLVAKELHARIGQGLTPTSDPSAIASAVLTGHDVVELVLAPLAQLVVPEQNWGREPSMMEYAGAVRKKRPTDFLGFDYLKQLNEARRTFKHGGLLPSTMQFHTVGDKVFQYVSSWCATFLGIEFADLRLDALIEDARVRELYAEARSLHQAGEQQQALEALGKGLMVALRGFPGMIYPRLGERHVEDALLLSAFGVRPSDYLAVQELLPEVFWMPKTDEFTVTWREREMGHEGNWTAENVAFCIDACVDVAIKAQHAPWAPWPLHYRWVFDDVATAKRDTILWTEDSLGRSQKQTPVAAGAVLRGSLVPHRMHAMPAALFRPAKVEEADVLLFMPNGDMSASGFIARVDFDISSERKRDRD